MRRIIQHQETLIYYDSPQLLVASDQFKTQYLCLLVEGTEHFDKFLCVPVTPLKLKDFCSGSVDLRDIYDHPESEEWFYVDVVGDIKDLQLIPLAPESLLENWLPAHDFYFQTNQEPENIVESPPVYQLSEEQLKDLLDLLKYKPLLELLSKQQELLAGRNFS